MKGLSPYDREAFAAELGLKTEPPQSYSVDGFYDLLTERIATLAHDLGNLLVPAKGRVDLIQRRARREDRQRDLRDVGEAGRAVDRVVSLVADLLDSSRLEQGLVALNRQPARAGALA